MSLFWLFLRSRLSERAALGLLAVSGGAWLWGRLLGGEQGALCLALLLFPLFAGSIPGIVTTSPFTELEQTASRSLFDLRAFQSAGLFIIAGAGLLAATWGWPEPDAWELIARNLSGFAGLGLLSAAMIGGRLSWVGPIACGIVLFSVAGEHASGVWAWAANPAGSDVATGAALTLFLAGLVLVCRFGARELSDG